MDSEARYRRVLDLYQKHLNPPLAKLMAFAGFGIEDHAEGCFIWDHEGRRYLDCLGGYGVFSLGHRHPKVVEAVKRQLDRMPLSGKAFFNEPQAELAAALAEITPAGLEFAFFGNSGAEAVEAAIKLAKGATGRMGIVSTQGGYHGKTIGALSVTGRKKYADPFSPLMPGVSFVEFGDAAALETAVGPETAAVIIEPIQGEGGIVIPPDGYLYAAREICDRHGAMLIADEVQTGLGRTGKWFGCDHEHVSPDLMPLAKLLGGGVMPIGAVMMTSTVFEANFGATPLIHTSTFGGNELACAAGMATIEVIREEGLVERSATQGAKMLAALQAACSETPSLVADVRGRGLMIGVEYSMDECGELVTAQLMKRGVVAAYTLNNPRVMRFEPPLVISDEEIEMAASALRDALAETATMMEEFGLLEPVS